MITATYQAVLSPPGGVWQEDKDQYSAGKSILATKSRRTFLMFIVGNSIGYYASLHMITRLTSGFPLQLALLSLTFCMSINYPVAMLNLVPKGDQTCSVVALISIIFASIAPLLPNLCRRLHFPRQKLPNCAYFRARFASLL
ncbi:hypothetical protein V8G54_031146 [Vigna mungo]|uniref:PGG domain-containing protein n=1 Tax=Vigna mungo TaxID=3915 RepID=A0AAQ3RP77_VIGMU